MTPLQITVTLPATVTNPIFTYNFDYTWSPTLGTGLATGSTIPCYSSISTSVICTLTVGSYNTGPSVSVTGLASISSGSSFDIMFTRIFNPATVGTSTVVANVWV
jgi:hypothetical protein